MRLKHRKGYTHIVLNGLIYQFTWARHKDGPMLIIYTIAGQRIVIPHAIWGTSPDSPEYRARPHVWHGKNKRAACFGGWGKAEAAEMWRKYNLL